MRVAMTETGHRDPAGKIEKFPTVGGVKIEAFAPFDGDIPPTLGRHNGWYHGSILRDFSGTISENAGFIVVAGAPCTQLSRAFPNAGSRSRDCLSSPSPRFAGSAPPPQPSSRKAAEYEEGYSACQFAPGCGSR